MIRERDSRDGRPHRHLSAATSRHGPRAPWRPAISEPLASAARRLIEYWASIGSRIKPGASEHDLRAFEQRHHVRLPPDFREYLTLCNGLSLGDGGHFDYDWLGLIEFWPLETISDRHDGVPGEYFGFADFLIDSHWYVIRLSADVHLSGAIGVGNELGIVEQLGDSFSDFVEAYLHAPDRIV